MPSILNLKFKGNKSFVAFSNLNDSESLTKTWKVCTRVASYLEQGQRLENLSWRLWHLQNLMVDTDNAKSKRDFKKLSRCMGDKLDKEKGRCIEELEAPDYRHNHSSELIRQRAAEKERSREASQNAMPGTIKRMQFTFSVDQPSPATNQPVKKPDFRPSTEFTKRTRSLSARNSAGNSPQSNEAPVSSADEANSADSQNPSLSQVSQSLRFPPLFSNDFGPSALLYATPTVTNSMNYGEGLNSSSLSNDGFSIIRPTIELPLDEILKNVEDANNFSFLPHPSNPAMVMSHTPYAAHSASTHQRQEDIVMQPIDISHPSTSTPEPRKTRRRASAAARLVAERNADGASARISIKPLSSSSPQNKDGSEPFGSILDPSQTPKDVLLETVVPSKVNSLATSAHHNPASPRPTLTVKTQTTTRSSGPGATATNTSSRAPNTGNSGPGGVKAECTNCGATHTPLWRRGLNDELNCNACGLYCKLHKRPRPKSMRNSHGEGRVQVAPRQETVDVMAQCYNCHTTATPLWRKDDEGKTVCNACGLYYKLHGSARPISMKSDVIRKRSRHDARRGGNPSETPSASPGVSRRASPAHEPSPTLAPDSTTQISYDYNEDIEYRSAQSELLGALGPDDNQSNLYSSSYPFQFPGPYHPDYLLQHYNLPSEPLPFNMENNNSSGNSSDIDPTMSPRSPKRRRMSTDSEPPSSAASYSSFDNFSTTSSMTSNSARSSVEFPFASYSCGSSSSSPGGQSNSPNGAIAKDVAMRGSSNSFWHPPMPALFHPPMLQPTDDSPMDYLHPPMVLPDDMAETLFSTYLHPPMAIPDENSQRGSISPNPGPAKSGSPGGAGDSGLEPFDSQMRVY